MVTIVKRGLNRCFYTRKDGSTGVLVHGLRFDLSDGSIVTYGRKSQSWVWKSPERFSTPVAKSLTNYQMSAVQDRGKMIRDRKEWFSTKNFLEWIVTEGKMSAEEALTMVK